MVLSKRVDSGLFIISLIISTMLMIVFYVLVFVKYEWCPVLFPNNTVRTFLLGEPVYAYSCLPQAHHSHTHTQILAMIYRGQIPITFINLFKPCFIEK